MIMLMVKGIVGIAIVYWFIVRPRESQSAENMPVSGSGGVTAAVKDNWGRMSVLLTPFAFVLTAYAYEFMDMGRPAWQTWAVGVLSALGLACGTIGITRGTVSRAASVVGILLNTGALALSWLVFVWAYLMDHA